MKDYQNDPAFLQASPEEKHRFLLETDTEYATGSPQDQQAFVASFPSRPSISSAPASSQPPSPEQDWVGQQLHRLPGYTGQEKEMRRRAALPVGQRVKEFATETALPSLLTGAGGVAGRAVAPAFPTLAPAIGRVAGAATSGAVDALTKGGDALGNLLLSGAVQAAPEALIGAPHMAVSGARVGMGGLRSLFLRAASKLGKLSTETGDWEKLATTSVPLYRPSGGIEKHIEIPRLRKPVDIVQGTRTTLTAPTEAQQRTQPAAKNVTMSVLQQWLQDLIRSPRSE